MNTLPTLFTHLLLVCCFPKMHSPPFRQLKWKQTQFKIHFDVKRHPKPNTGIAVKNKATTHPFDSPLVTAHSPLHLNTIKSLDLGQVLVKGLGSGMGLGNKIGITVLGAECAV